MGNEIMIGTRKDDSYLHKLGMKSTYEVQVAVSLINTAVNIEGVVFVLVSRYSAYFLHLV